MLLPVIHNHPAASVRDEVDPFLRTHGSMGPLNPTDHVILARQGDDLVGCVRLAQEQGVAVFRSLVVHPDMRGLGLGKRLMREAQRHAQTLGMEEVYGIAFPNLEEFYGGLGLRVIPESALPPHLQRRARGLAAHGYETIGLVWRAAPQSSPDDDAAGAGPS
jgi:N-acetylglutamate synthase-like GNAT family acetyltransferase